MAPRQADTVPAAILGFIHRLVRQSDQVLLVPSVILKSRDAKTGGEMDIETLRAEKDMAMEGAMESFGNCAAGS